MSQTSKQQEYLAFARQVAKEAGEIVLDACQKKKSIKVKSVSIDLVTETDQIVEKFIFQRIQQSYPSHVKIGEESAVTGQAYEWTDSPTWIVDPIDGTMNFVHGFPHFCICIGFAICKQVVLGVIYNPVCNQMYYASKGHGAFMNDEMLHVSAETVLSKALIMTEFSHDTRKANIHNKVENLRSLMNIPIHGVRSLGSCAWNMCQVASGVADAYFEFGVHCWDFAAGIIIVQEAGGYIADSSLLGKMPLKQHTDMNGDCNLDLFGRKIVCAGTQELATELMATLDSSIDFIRD